jgi:hypothetical protein
LTKAKVPEVFMNFKPLAIFFIFFAILIQPICVLSFETDQYNLPPKPLGDIGVEVTEYAEQKLRDSVEKINGEISELKACLEKTSGKGKCKSPEKARKELAYLQSEEAIAKAVFKRLGGGVVPFTKVSLWMEWHKFKAQPARYRTSYPKSIYLTAPFNYLTISPTVNLYETNLGTDKVAHIFQQGYGYYGIYKRSLAKGSTEIEAVKKAVKWGRKTEKTYFGTLVSGVYSNADLAANYSGLKFYQGLTHEIKIGESVRPAVLILKDGIWEFNKNADLREILLKPFISKHLNEAYNPSKIFNIFGFRDYVRRVVRKRSCKQWLERYPDLSQTDLEATTKSLELWHGEDYGFSYSKNFVTIANTCFENERSTIESLS